MIMTARQVLNKYWDGKIPVDPIAIANAVGIKVFIADLPNDLSGVIWKNPENNEVEIITNKEHHPNRRRFTVAHELGHFFSTNEFEGQIEDNIIYNRDNSSSPKERAANSFAANLLMPADKVDDYIIKRNIRTLSGLADAFEVSKEAMNIHLINLGIVNG